MVIKEVLNLPTCGTSSLKDKSFPRSIFILKLNASLGEPLTEKVWVGKFLKVMFKKVFLAS